MNPEKVLPIEDKQGLQIEALSDSPKITSENDFDVAYNKGLKQKGVGLYDANISIVKDGTQFLIGPKDGQKFTEYVKVENISLLKDFIRYTTDHYYRDLFSSVHNNFNIDISTTKITKKNAGVESTQEVINVVIKEELNQLKEDISFQQVLDGCKALTSGGTIILADGTKKFYAKGQYEELRELIAVTRPKRDDIIYNQNFKIFTQIINEQKDNVRTILTQANALKNNNYTQNHSEILLRRKQELDHIHAQYSQIEKYIIDPALMNRPFDATIYNTDLAIYSSKDIKTLQKKIGKQDIEMTKIDEGMFNTALLKLDLDDRQEFRVYLNEVIAGSKDPSTEKYTPKNKEKFVEILAQYPQLKRYIDFYVNKKEFNPAVQNNIVGNKGGLDKTEYLDPTSPKFEEQMKNNPKYADRKNAFAKGGISGLAGYGLDQTNMKPEQKQFRGGMGQLAMVGGAVFVGWNMLKSAFNLITGAHKGDKDEDKAARRKERARLLGPAAIVFGLQATTGEGVGGVIHGGKGTERLTNLFGGKGNTTEKTLVELTSEQTIKTKEFQEKYGEGMTGSIAIFNGMKYSDIKELVEQKDSKMKLRPASRKAFMEKFGTDNPNVAERNPAGYKFLSSSIGEKDENNMIDLSLNALGITREKLQDTKNNDTDINETYAKVAVKLSTITAFMEEKSYIRINPDRMDKLEEYLADADATADQLDELAKKYPDMFIKEVIKDKTDQKLGEKIKALSKGDLAKEESLLVGLNKFYEYMPNASKTIDIVGAGPEVIFKTYGQGVKINLDKKSLIGFTPARFDSYAELFKAASLTNRIQFLCKDKKAIKPAPFYVSALGSDIMFDDAKFFSTDFDTEITSAGLRGALDEISPTLGGDNKQAYCDYLNTLRFWKPATPA